MPKKIFGDNGGEFTGDILKCVKDSISVYRIQHHLAHGATLYVNGITKQQSFC